MINPDEWTIKMLFHQYHEDMRVLKREHSKQHIDFMTLYNKQEELDKLYT